MNKLIHQFSNYSFWQIGKEMMPEAVRFVVETNYKHHQQGKYPLDIDDEIKMICQEEKNFFSSSFFFVIEDHNTNKIIGTVRAFRWVENIKLPIQEKMSVDINQLITDEELLMGEKWFIGRFAIDFREMGRASVLILKMLLVNVFQVACPTCGSILLAELDKKLFEKLKIMGIHFTQIGESEVNLGSETIPAYITSQGLSSFLEKHKHLCYV